MADRVFSVTQTAMYSEATNVCPSKTPRSLSTNGYSAWIGEGSALTDLPKYKVIVFISGRQSCVLSVAPPCQTYSGHTELGLQREIAFERLACVFVGQHVFDFELRDIQIPNIPILVIRKGIVRARSPSPVVCRMATGSDSSTVASAWAATMFGAFPKSPSSSPRHGQHPTGRIPGVYFDNPRIDR